MEIGLIITLIISLLLVTIVLYHTIKRGKKIRNMPKKERDKIINKDLDEVSTLSSIRGILKIIFSWFE